MRVTGEGNAGADEPMIDVFVVLRGWIMVHESAESSSTMRSRSFKLLLMLLGQGAARQWAYRTPASTAGSRSLGDEGCNELGVREEGAYSVGVPPCRSGPYVRVLVHESGRFCGGAVAPLAVVYW